MSESADQGRNGGPVRTDPTFYRTAAEAAAAPAEQLAYVVAFDRAGAAARRDDRRRRGPGLGRATAQVVGWTDLPTRGDELHHFGWNACSSALKHEGHDMRRPRAALPAACPGLRSSQHPRARHPARPALSRTLRQDDRRGGAGREGRLLPPAHPALRPRRDLPVLPRRRRRRRRRAGRDRAARPRRRSTCCAPGRPTAARSTSPTTPGGTSTRTSLITSEWGTPSMIEDGIVPELLLGQKYGHALHFWDLADGRHLQTRRPRRRSTRWCWSCARPTTPRRPGGSSASSISTEDLSGVGLALAPRRRRRGRPTRSSRSRPSRPTRTCCRPRCSRSAPCRRWSPTSTCRSTTGSSTSPAGAPASSSSTTCRDPAHPREVGLGAARRHRRAGRRTRRRPTSRSPAARRWSRSAATAGASTSPTRSTAPGTTSSTRTASAPGWPSSTPTRPAG